MKRFLTALFFSITILVVFTHSVNAQEPVKNTVQDSQSSPKSVYPLNTDSDVPQNFHTYSQNVFIEILTSISCMLTGYDPLNGNGKCLGINMETHKIGYVEGGGGAVGFVGNMIASTFKIPVSSTIYAKDLAANFGITKTSVAAGTVDVGGQNATGSTTGYGYVGLRPVLGMWKLFRNIVYLFFVLIFIVIGLGIMLRVNVDARSVMSIQNQLPKIIIGIILITLSYAIAGFIVDMMYVVMYLVYYIFYTFTQQGTGVDIGGLNPSFLQGTTPLGAIGGLSGTSSIAAGAAAPFGHIIASLFDNTFGTMIASLVGGLIGAGAGSIVPGIGTIIGGIFGAAVGAFAGSKLLGIVGGLLAYIIITVAVLWAMFRLWFLLLRSYIFFLIDVILAPFWIGLGLLPKGASAGFGSWLRDTIANLAVFPASLFILLLGKILIGQFEEQASAHPFVPPLIGNPGDMDSFGPIIGLGIILLLPSVVTMVRETLKAPGFKYTQQIAQSIGVGQKLTGAATGKVKDALWHTNPKTGEPERLKGWFLKRARESKGAQKVVAVAKSPLTGARRTGEALGSKIPGLRGKVAAGRSDRIAKSHLEQSRNKGGVGYNDTSRKGYGTNKGWINEQEVEIKNNQVRLPTIDGNYKDYDVRDVHFDRLGFDDTPNAVNPEDVGQAGLGDVAVDAGVNRRLAEPASPHSLESLLQLQAESGRFSEEQMNQLRQLFKNELSKPEHRVSNPNSLVGEDLDHANRALEAAKSQLPPTQHVEGGPIADGSEEEPPPNPNP